MKENKYPLFRRGCIIAFLVWIVTILFWQSAVLSFCLAALPVIITMIWREKEFPAMPFALGFQWLQVSIGIIWRDVFGAKLNAVNHPKIESACYLGIIGLLVLGLAFRLGFMLGDRIFSIKALPESSDNAKYSINKVFAVYLVLLFLTPMIVNVSWKFMQIRSILTAVFPLQYFIIFLLFYLSITYDRSIFILGILSLEVLQGMVGYFSGYKTSLLIFAIVAFADLRKLTLRMRYILLGVILSLFVLSVVWQAIKPELRRAFSSGGISLNSSWEEKLKFVYSLADKIFRGGDTRTQPDQYKVYGLVDRISNIYYFANVLSNVPSEIPHEDGKLLGASIKHLFSPRLFFPDKPGLASDSWMVRLYANVYVAGDEKDTNIALGYLVEDYIDFGIPYMFIPVFILGFLAAIMYRYIFKVAINSLFANLLSASIFFFNFYLFETANIKMFGNILSNYIVCLAWLMLFQKQFLEFITKKYYPRVA